MLATSFNRPQVAGMVVADASPTDAVRIAADVAGNRLELLEGGSERLSAILALIDGARSSIKLLFYMFNPDAAGEAVREAVVRAARRGVTVQLLLDGFGSSATAAFLQPIADEGGSFILFHPSLGRRYLLR